MKWQIRAFVHDDQRMLELSRARRIQAEIALQRDFARERPWAHKRNEPPDQTAPCSAANLWSFGVTSFHEIRVCTISGVFACQRAFHVGVNDALFCDFLRGHYDRPASESYCAPTPARDLLSACRNAQPIERVLDILRHVLPFGLHTRIRADIGVDMIHIEPFRWTEPQSGTSHVI